MSSAVASPAAGTPFLDQHHIRPRSEGGSHSADNLVRRTPGVSQLRSTEFLLRPPLTILHPPEPALSSGNSAGDRINGQLLQNREDK
jgi:hypothetical protein